MKGLSLDHTDLVILRLLQRDSNITNAQLAKEIGLSPAPTLERVNKLRQASVIRGFHADIDPGSLGLGVSTFVTITLKSHNKSSVENFVDAINQIDEVIECHHITGEGDFILRVVCSDITAYQRLIVEKITDIDVVEGLQSTIILSTFKNSKGLPIPE